MKKLARACAYRLSKEHLEKEAAQLKAQNKNEGNKFNFKKRTQVNNVEKVSMNTVGVKKKVDDVNTDYIRYVQEREKGKQIKESEREAKIREIN